MHLLLLLLHLVNNSFHLEVKMSLRVIIFVIVASMILVVVKIIRGMSIK
jgi:hypothetical protein